MGFYIIQYLFIGYYHYNCNMIDKKKTLKLLNYINTPMSRDSIIVLYGTHNIKYEKCELYNDYVQSLTHLIFDTYMGDDITNKNEQKNHFKWCWNKNIENFKTEGIFIDNKELYLYFFSFMVDVFYQTSKKDDDNKVKKNIQSLWDYLFDFHNKKSKSDMDTLIEVYQLFEGAK